MLLFYASKSFLRHKRLHVYFLCSSSYVLAVWLLSLLRFRSSFSMTLLVISVPSTLPRLKHFPVVRPSDLFACRISVDPQKHCMHPSSAVVYEWRDVKSFGLRKFRIVTDILVQIFWSNMWLDHFQWQSTGYTQVVHLEKYVVKGGQIKQSAIEYVRFPYFSGVLAFESMDTRSNARRTFMYYKWTCKT